MGHLFSQVSIMECCVHVLKQSPLLGALGSDLMWFTGPSSAPSVLAFKQNTNFLPWAKQKEFLMSICLCQLTLICTTKDCKWKAVSVERGRAILEEPAHCVGFDRYPLLLALTENKH